VTSARTNESFPVPDDIEGFWLWDKIHATRPMTPLSDEMVFSPIGPGFTVALGEVACPAGMASRAINGYAYAAFYALDLGSETIEKRLERYTKDLDEIVPQVGRLWTEEWLPSIMPQLEKARTTDVTALSDADLWKFVEEQMANVQYRWTIHGRINLVLIAASWFADFYKETFAPEDPTEPYLLLQGVMTKSIETGRGLWRLSRIVAASPALTRLFQETDSRSLEAELEKTEEGRRFLAELTAWLVDFGWRSDLVYDIADPTWIEDHSIALNTLQGFVQLGDDADPDAHFEESVKRRESLVARRRADLANDPAKLKRFNDLYEAARWNLPLTEDHNFWIDQMGITLLRRPALELGRRLVERGAIADKNDVFYLYLADIREGMAGKDQRALVLQRKDDLARWGKMVPPLGIGEQPPPTGDPFEEALLFKMFGFGLIEPDRESDIITGIPASPGAIQGTAKVCITLSEASKLQKGDIMFCEQTLPPWTPLFSTVAAVVADTGGVLSHCAIVAREYRLPAVVGTVIGTKTVKDGWTVTVDGSKGVVRIDKR
jgi:pyruvate,water dikinase